MSRLYFLVQKIGPPAKTVLRWISKVPPIGLFFLFFGLLGLTIELLQWAFGSG